MKKQNLFAIVMLTVLIIGAISLFSWKKAPLCAIPDTETETLTALVTNQNMETKESKIFSDFIYDVGPRFGAIKKSEIDNITSIDYFLEDEVMQNMVSIKSTSFILVVDDQPSNIKVFGNTATFNKEQLEFLKSASYSTSFGMHVEFDEKDPNSGHIFDSYRSPYHTIVPEQQAEYSQGKKALKRFLKESCQEVLIGVNPDKLKPAKLYFTVTKEGRIENISLDRESGYPEVDKKMIELIKQTPGNWKPAKNSSGETVNQELVVSFGLMGC